MQDKKKLLILVDWFVPGYKAGGPIRSCANICAALNNRYDIYVLTTDTDHGDDNAYPGITSNKWIYNTELNVQVYYAQKKGLSFQQLGSQVQLVNADFIYLNHLFSPRFVVYPLWLAIIKKIKGKIVVCPRGALYNSALSVKRYKKAPLLLLYRWLSVHKRVTFHATNKREATAIVKFFPGSQVVVADNLPGNKQLPFLAPGKKEGELRCIFIARIVPIKNLLFILKVLQNTTETVILTVVGPAEDEQYLEECKKQTAQLPANISVLYTGAKASSELAGLIQQHHLFVLPTTGENFGHAIFEALQAGRPVLISDQTPWRNLPEKNAGWDLPLNQPELFSDVISQMARSSEKQFRPLAAGAWQYANDFINNPAALQQYHILFS